MLSNKMKNICEKLRIDVSQKVLQNNEGDMTQLMKNEGNNSSTPKSSGRLKRMMSAMKRAVKTKKKQSPQSSDDAIMEVDEDRDYEPEFDYLLRGT